MIVTTAQGARFEVLVQPGAAGAGVPPPYTVQGFLSTVPPAERRALLASLGGSPTVSGVDPMTTRSRPSDGVVLKTLVALTERRVIGFAAPGSLPGRVKPAGGGSTAGAKAKPKDEAPAPAAVREVVCELLAATATGAKGRKASRAGVLEVVPGTEPALVKIDAELRGGCGKHPQWTVHSLGADDQKVGAHASFVAKPWTLKTFGIFEVLPKTYRVDVSCCAGASRTLEVRAFPNDVWSINATVDFKKPPTQWKFDLKLPGEDTGLKLKSDLLKSVQDRQKQLKWALDKTLVPLVGNSDEWEFFKTKLSFGGQWAENAADHRAFYQLEGSLSLDPLLKGSFTIPFGPTSAIPPWIKKWTTDLIGDLYLYLKFEGEVKLKGSWKRATVDDWKAEVKGEGSIGVKVGGNLFLMKKSALNLDVNGGTSITATAKAPAVRRPAVEFDLEWSGLTIELTIEAAWGMVEYKRKWQPIAKQSFFDAPKVWHPLGEAASA
ncbi:MAG: hypothetical protein JWM10_5177 [Myxococcaceae bacterium]|nr:hypothetical protein [Myxococcaceae bacterium]